MKGGSRIESQMISNGSLAGFLLKAWLAEKLESFQISMRRAWEEKNFQNILKVSLGSFRIWRHIHSYTCTHISLCKWTHEHTYMHLHTQTQKSYKKISLSFVIAKSSKSSRKLQTRIQRIQPLPTFWLQKKLCPTLIILELSRVVIHKQPPR